MDEASVSELFELKTAIRKQAHENRRSQTEKDSVSKKIVNRFIELPEYQAAHTIMFYVDVRDEVRTRQALPAAVASGKRIIVPYCVNGELELFWLENMEELELGMYRIETPPANRSRFSHGARSCFRPNWRTNRTRERLLRQTTPACETRRSSHRFGI